MSDERPGAKVYEIYARAEDGREDTRRVMAPNALEASLIARIERGFAALIVRAREVDSLRPPGRFAK